MNITEIPFKWLRGQGDRELKGEGQLSWSAPYKLPLPARIFGRPQEFINFSNYGGVRFPFDITGDGRVHYAIEDGTLPEGIDDFKKGFSLVPWGEPQRINNCGNTRQVYVVGDIIVIDVVSSSHFEKRMKYSYQIQVPTRQPNIVEFHYYNCQSGYNTFIGAVEKPDNFIGWDLLKPLQAYHKKALRIDTSLDTTAIIDPVITIDPVTPSDNDWKTISRYADYGVNYRVQRQGE